MCLLLVAAPPPICLQELPPPSQKDTGKRSLGRFSFPLAGLSANVPGDRLCHLDRHMAAGLGSLLLSPSCGLVSPKPTANSFYTVFKTHMDRVGTSRNKNSWIFFSLGVQLIELYSSLFYKWKRDFQNILDMVVKIISYKWFFFFGTLLLNLGSLIYLKFP